MPIYTVVLNGRTQNEKPEFFTPHNEIVSADARGVWNNFQEAHKAALRAALQDPLSRRVTVKEY